MNGPGSGATRRDRVLQKPAPAGGPREAWRRAGACHGPGSGCQPAFCKSLCPQVARRGARRRARACHGPGSEGHPASRSAKACAHRWPFKGLDGEHELLHSDDSLLNILPANLCKPCRADFSFDHRRMIHDGGPFLQSYEVSSWFMGFPSGAQRGVHTSARKITTGDWIMRSGAWRGHVGDRRVEVSRNVSRLRGRPAESFPPPKPTHDAHAAVRGECV